ncbi:MAG: flagellar hook capping FlgD N-terminal domain-containing protein [Pseudomonadota bacterium]
MEITPNPSILPGPVGRIDTAAATAEEAAAAADADFESFLTLLTAQLRNQDPLQPIDSTEFVAQLATFSSVEQQVQTNEKLDTLVSQAAAGDIAAFAGWIGQQVAASDGSFRATGSPQSFAVPPGIAAERVNARVVGADGETLRNFTVATDAAGNGAWDGLDQDGRPVAGRDVSILLSFGEGEAAVERPALVYREVSGIRGTDTGPVLDLEDGSTLAPDGVTELRRPPVDN